MLGRSLLMVALAAVAALVWTFLPQRLAVPAGPAEALPALEHPAVTRIGVIETGTMQSSALFAYRGGGFEPRELGMDVVLVEHPKGRLLIDTGFGSRVAEHARTIPLLMRAVSTLTPATPALKQLEALGYTPKDFAGVLLTHVHWDHVSGLDDLREVPVWINAAEHDFIASGGDASLLMRGFAGLKFQTYAFDGGPYAGWPASHDVFGDGSVVVVPAGGHTPGSVIIFVRTPGRDYAFIGDLAWQHEGVDLPAERPWLARVLVDQDAAVVREQLVRLHQLQAYSPRLTVVPAHDRRVMASLPRAQHPAPAGEAVAPDAAP